MQISPGLAARGYQTLQDKIAPDAKTSGNSLAGATQSFADVLKTGEMTAEKAMTGGIDPHALVEALAQSELAVETTVAVRDKVVEAYQEILRMPV